MQLLAQLGPPATSAHAPLWQRTSSATCATMVSSSACEQMSFHGATLPRTNSFNAACWRAIASFKPFGSMVFASSVLTTSEVASTINSGIPANAFPKCLDPKLSNYPGGDALLRNIEQTALAVGLQGAEVDIRRSTSPRESTP